MKNEKDIKSYFNDILKNIDIILENSFYKENDKENLKNIKNLINKWYKSYLDSNKLIEIEPKKLEYIDLEITDFFAKYIETESAKENYAERLLYDFGRLEHLWKDEMLGKK